MHAIEELSEPPYLYAEFLDYEITDAHGRVSKMRVRCHNFKGWVQRYDRLAQLLDRSSLRQGKVLNAGCQLIESTAMWPAVNATLKEDPLFFVDRENTDNA